MVISVCLSLNNMRSTLRCIVFCHQCLRNIKKSELQYLSLLNTNECDNDLVKVNVSLERFLLILYRK